MQLCSYIEKAIICVMSQQDKDETQESYQKHDSWKDRNEEAFNKAELIVAKKRNGPTGKIELYFEDNIQNSGSRKMHQTNISNEI